VFRGLLSFSAGPSRGSAKTGVSVIWDKVIIFDNDCCIWELPISILLFRLFSGFGHTKLLIPVGSFALPMKKE